MRLSPSFAPAVLLALFPCVASAQATHLQYAGALEKDGAPVTASIDMRFGIWDGDDTANPDATDCLEAETPAAAPACATWWQELDAVTVAAGRFTARLAPTEAALALAAPHLQVVIYDDGAGVWRKLGGLSPIDPAFRASSASLGGQLVTRFESTGTYVLSVDPSEPGSDDGYNNWKHLDLEPVSGTLCFVSGNYFHLSGALNGTELGNMVVDHSGACAVYKPGDTLPAWAESDPNPPPNNGRWILTAYAGRLFSDRPVSGECVATCVRYRQ